MSVTDSTPPVGAGWLEVRAGLPQTNDASPFIEIYRDHGIENTLEENSSLTGCLPNVSGALEQIDRLVEALREAGAREVRTRDLPEENWDEAWRKFFKPRRVGRHFVIRPTWEAFPAEAGDIEIVLDPGQAFGTGDHPTTRMCLELLEDAEVADARVADVGCGSGILSVAACKLGAAEVVAVDIEPVSVEVAKENAELNGVRFLALVGEGIGPALDPSLGASPVSEQAGFDVLVSNIISAILIRIASDAYEAVVEGGRWIVSGIIAQNWPDVQDAAERAGFTLKQKREEDGWVGAMFVR